MLYASSGLSATKFVFGLRKCTQNAATVFRQRDVKRQVTAFMRTTTGSRAHVRTANSLTLLQQCLSSSCFRPQEPSHKPSLVLPFVGVAESLCSGYILPVQLHGRRLFAATPAAHTVAAAVNAKGVPRKGVL